MALDLIEQSYPVDEAGITARAVHQLERGEADGSGTPARWRATGSDPRFALDDNRGSPLRVRGGWYWLAIEFATDSGELHAPRLYVDYGGGYSETDSFPLAALAGAHGIAGVVRFTKHVQRLRFDPANRASEFTLGRITLKRLSKPAAALSLYRAIASRDGQPLRLAREALTIAWRGRPRLRGVGDWLYQRYAGLEASIPLEYPDWVARFDTYGWSERRRMARDAQALQDPPLISLVMPVYNTPEAWLKRCIESVRRQVYPHWELCIADDASNAPHVRRMLRRYARRDRRIKVVFRESNGHISAASNSALELAGGEWIALLDHDDELPAHALYAVAQAIHEHPDARLIYSDEDKINERGQRFDPYFKPDWNYDLFLGQNMISHLGVYHADLVRSVGGFREGFEGSQDYDLALRCIERIQSGQILHIPRVLYHWRAIAGSTALAPDEKNYAAVAGGRALQEHFARTGEAARAEVHSFGYRVRRGFNGDPPSVSLIIPTRDRIDLLRVCVESILERTEYPDYEIIVVDNQSVEPGTFEYFESLRGRDRVRVLRYDEPFNFSSINNYAVAHSRGELVGLINNDIEAIHSDWLTEMASHAVRPEIGAVGAMLYYPNDTIQHAGVLLGPGGVAGHLYCGMPRGHRGQMSRALVAQELSVITAACVVVKRKIYDEVGGLDPQLQVAFNDVDFCLRILAAGYRNLWTPFAELYHHESASRGYEDTPEKQARFEREIKFMQSRWGDSLLRDPAYNANLTLTGEPFGLAVPPRVARLQ